MPKSRRPKKRPRSKPSPKFKRAKPRSTKAAKQKRSAAAKKGWAKRRKKKRLHEAMAELRARKSDLPAGWIERRASLRSIHGGKHWQQISLDFDVSNRDRARLAALAELEIDMLTSDELYDYLAWLAEELEIDISDLYRMYLGYEVGEAASA